MFPGCRSSGGEAFESDRNDCSIFMQCLESAIMKRPEEGPDSISAMYDRLLTGSCASEMGSFDENRVLLGRLCCRKTTGC